MKKLMMLAALVSMAALFTGCSTPKKVRDIELKGMYVNGYSEVVAIGAGRLTSIPGEREALAAHYEEDTAWLSPTTKTHKFDIFLVGTNSVENSKAIISSICKAFADVAPQIAATHAAKAGGTTALDVVKGGGEVRKAAALAKNALKTPEAVNLTENAPGLPAAAGCPDGSCAEDAGCTDCEVK